MSSGGSDGASGVVQGTSGVAKAAKADVAKAPAQPKKAKGGKVARERSIIDDLITLMVCIGCTLWAVKVIVGLSAQSF